jgi:hypothetical protein
MPSRLPLAAIAVAIVVIAPLRLETGTILMPVAFFVRASVPMRLFFVPSRFIGGGNGMEDSVQILRRRFGCQSHGDEASETDH